MGVVEHEGDQLDDLLEQFLRHLFYVGFGLGQDLLRELLVLDV